MDKAMLNYWVKLLDEGLVGGKKPTIPTAIHGPPLRQTSPLKNAPTPHLNKQLSTTSNEKD